MDIEHFLETEPETNYYYNRHNYINKNDELEELFDSLSSYIGYGLIGLTSLIISYFAQSVM
jgi:hypothetical protein